MKIDETLLELKAMRWFEATGWATAEGPDLSPGGAQDERGSHEGVLNDCSDRPYRFQNLSLVQFLGKPNAVGSIVGYFSNSSRI